MMRAFLLISNLFYLSACVTDDSHETEMLEGKIYYPFAKPPGKLGHNVPSEKFVIKSAVGNKEYSIEIPGGADDYDVEIPIANLMPHNSEEQAKNIGSAAKTDQELIQDLPSLGKAFPAETAMMDRAFGVGEKDGPKQSPSYSLGLAKATEFYKQRNYEYALIEVNNLLGFYPNSPKLLKMKGTLLLKLQNYLLAEKAWARALSLSENDLPLKKALQNLRERLEFKTKKEARRQTTP